MMHTFTIEQKNRNTAPCNYFAGVTSDFRCMYNTANFYIRNTMTGIQKSPEERTNNETEVLYEVFRAVQERKESIRMEIGECRKLHGLYAEAEMKRILGRADFSYPTEKKWLLSYGLLDAIFKLSGNPVYQRMPSQVNQNAIRKVVSAWKSYLGALKEYGEHPERFTGKPRIPGYIREEQAPAWWTNQTAKMRILDGKAFLQFVNCKEMFCIGNASQYEDMKYVRTEVKPANGRYYVLVTMEDSTSLPVLEGTPSRILGVDLGVGNFAAVAGNFGVVPFLVKGGAVKAANQWFNKERARLFSALTKGSDSRHSRKQSLALHALSRKRSDFLRDFFYKCAWYICRYAVKYKVQAIVVGHNKFQKQEAGMGKVNNQSFVSIPFDRFRQVLVCTAAKCGIPVVLREESYTSQASLLDLDDIPTYKKGCKAVYAFSGKRIRRGMYRASDGRVLNADVNGAGNILRKEFPHAFDGLTFDYLYKTTQVVRFRDLYKEAPGPDRKPGKRHRRGYFSRVPHAYRKAERQKYRELFQGKRTSSKKATGAAGAA